MNRARIFDRLRVLENCRWIETKRDHRGRMQPFGICLIEPVLRDLKPAA
ncbi:MAG: hypothetical protein KF895_03120 [Parvibaculum sp.]|nr:hypothetical protein [Parvibaculum sp.]